MNENPHILTHLLDKNCKIYIGINTLCCYAVVKRNPLKTFKFLLHTCLCEIATSYFSICQKKIHKNDTQKPVAAFVLEVTLRELQMENKF